MQPVIICSGGQTGVDRAALDAALELGLDYVGWCPRGGWAEDLPAPPGLLARYPGLQETPSRRPAQRTRWNLQQSDLVLTLTRADAASPGTDVGVDFARQLPLPALTVLLEWPEALDQARAFLAQHPGPGILAVGGPRESEAPGIYRQARAWLGQLLA